MRSKTGVINDQTPQQTGPVIRDAQNKTAGEPDGQDTSLEKKASDAGEEARKQN